MAVIPKAAGVRQFFLPRATNIRKYTHASVHTSSFFGKRIHCEAKCLQLEQKLKVFPSKVSLYYLIFWSCKNVLAYVLNMYTFSTRLLDPANPKGEN